MKVWLIVVVQMISTTSCIYLKRNGTALKKQHSLTVNNRVPIFIHGSCNTKQKFTLRPLREDVGLASPPTPFYTNDNESVNALRKGCVAFKKQQWHMFNTKVKKYVDDLQNEMEKAIVGCGQYH